MTYVELLNEIAEREGYPSADDMLSDADVVLDSIVPAICCNPGCLASHSSEPDAEANYCEECEGQTVKSALILAGVI